MYVWMFVVQSRKNSSTDSDEVEYEGLFFGLTYRVLFISEMLTVPVG